MLLHYQGSLFCKFWIVRNSD